MSTVQRHAQQVIFLTLLVVVIISALEETEFR